MRLRTVAADVLGTACSWIDGLPDWTWRIPLLHRLGCPWGLLIRAALWLDPTDYYPETVEGK